MLSQEQLQAIRERAERATAGPWATCKSEDGQFINRKARFHYDHAGRVLIESPTHCKDHIVADASCNNTCIEIMEQEDNAEFIAHARTDIPAILANIEELEAKLKEATVPLHERDGFEYDITRLAKMDTSAWF